METKELNVFISQPMHNKTKEELDEVIERVSKKVKNYFDSEVNIMQSTFDTSNIDINVKNKSLYWLSRSIEVLSNSDVIIMATGWETCRGCRVEYECARLYDIMVIYEDTKYITQDKLFEVDTSDTTPDN